MIAEGNKDVTRLMSALATPAMSRRAAVSGALGVAMAPHASSALSQADLPPIGLGTCCDGYDASYATVMEGVRTGYRLFDTAAHYDSEPAVGAALADARKRGLLDEAPARTVTKIWFDNMGYEPALASVKASLSNLQTERLDVLLIHFPGSYDAVQSPARNKLLRAETWRACETLLADGRARSIGLSNYTPRQLRETLASCRTPPSVLQTEIHPRFQQRDLVEYAREQGVGTIMAHCPLAHGSPMLLRDPTLARLAAQRGGGCTPAMLCLRWSLDGGFIPVPKASSAARLVENLAAMRMSPLSADERAAIDALDAGDRVSFDPKLIA